MSYDDWKTTPPDDGEPEERCVFTESDMATEVRRSAELAIRLDLARAELKAAKQDCSHLRRAWIQLCDLVGEWGRGAPNEAQAAMLVLQAVIKLKQERDHMKAAK